jgi:hypothetical protein
LSADRTLSRTVSTVRTTARELQPTTEIPHLREEEKRATLTAVRYTLNSASVALTRLNSGNDDESRPDSLFKIREAVSRGMRRSSRLEIIHRDFGGNCMFYFPTLSRRILRFRRCQRHLGANTLGMDKKCPSRDRRASPQKISSLQLDNVRRTDIIARSRGAKTH